ncbi:hypothetical protein J6590_015705 [Homalodisca vitripennis]|nr:hypothetical protein J6590_015705 [Homalodisca vitripennis]
MRGAGCREKAVDVAPSHDKDVSSKGIQGVRTPLQVFNYFLVYSGQGAGKLPYPACLEATEISSDNLPLLGHSRYAYVNTLLSSIATIGNLLSLPTRFSVKLSGFSQEGIGIHGQLEKLSGERSGALLHVYSPGNVRQHFNTKGAAETLRDALLNYLDACSFCPLGPSSLYPNVFMVGDTTLYL